MRILFGILHCTMIENKVNDIPSSFDFGYGTKKLHFLWITSLYLLPGYR